jgi:hypothetical protein
MNKYHTLTSFHLSAEFPSRKPWAIDALKFGIGKLSIPVDESLQLSSDDVFSFSFHNWDNGKSSSSLSSL